MSAIYGVICAAAVAFASWLWLGEGRGRLRGDGPSASSPAPLERLRRSAPIARLESRARTAAIEMACLDELPEMLDVLTLGLSAGLSFDAALAIYCSRTTGVLRDLLHQSQMSWRLGIATRTQALDALAANTRVGALARFSSAVTEALRFGVPLSDSLQQQASALRDDQRRQVEEAIERVPVKMLIPLGVLVVPAMLIAILGPLLASASATTP